MWVKICGNTNLEDARLAAQLGADAVGFVFAPSVRQVTAAQVGRITPHLPESVERVGVFPAWSAVQIAGAVRVAGLTTIQLHGGLDIALARRLYEDFDGAVRVIQVVHWLAGIEGQNGQGIEAQVEQSLSAIESDGIAERTLVDSRVGAATGGTGIQFDWIAAASVFSRRAVTRRVILAGGLDPENVTGAIRSLRPWGVDVASGVEGSPGKKSPEKMATFFKQALACTRAPISQTVPL